MDVNHYDDAKIALIESRCKSNTQDGVTLKNGGERGHTRKLGGHGILGGD